MPLSDCCMLVQGQAIQRGSACLESGVGHVGGDGIGLCPGQKVLDGVDGVRRSVAHESSSCCWFGHVGGWGCTGEKREEGLSAETRCGLDHFKLKVQISK